MSEHAKYSPSSVYRNLSCKGALSLIEDLKSKNKITFRESQYAKEGTVAHNYIHDALSAIHSQIHYDFDVIPDIEMSTHVKAYCAFIGELNTKFRFTCEDVKHYLEHRVKYDNDFWGTADYVLTGYHKKTKAPMAVICDFKYGRGVEVEVEDNEQILSYAICLQKTMKRKFSMVHCFIYQPRTPGKEFNRWSIDENILAGAEQSIIANKEECLSLIGKDYSKSLCAGDWCRFCPAKHDGNCPEFNRDINSTQLKILDNVPEVVPTLPALTLEQKVEIFKRRKVFKKFIDEVCTDLLLTANSGVKVPGHKIVEGQRKRGWRKDTPMELIHADLMGLGVEQPMKLSLKGIGEIEKEIGKGKIGDLTELSKPTYQLVPDTDKRVEVKNIGLDEIEEIELE